MVREVLLLGHPALYEVSTPVSRQEAQEMASVVADMHDTLMAYRKKHGAGRAIAAPQISVGKRLIYMPSASPPPCLIPS